MNPTLGGGLAALLLLVLMLVIAERKARAAIDRRETRGKANHLTPRELARWRAKGQKTHSDEVEALKRADEAYGAKERKRSGEWKRTHDDKE